MKICWDILEKVTYNKDRGRFRFCGVLVHYHDSCSNCGDPFLGQKKKSRSCSPSCSASKENNAFFGKKHSQEFIEKMRSIKTGKSPSQETRNKMSISGKNKPPASEETRKKLSISAMGRKGTMLGKSHSEETKKKMSKAKKGKKCSEKHKQNIKDFHADVSGSKNPNWRGGIRCEPYCTQWTDKEYKNRLKYERDEGKCQNPGCSHKTTRLCLHHINYIKKDCRPTNLITVCYSCNAKANYDREWHEAFYIEIIRRKYENHYLNGGFGLQA